MEEEDLSFLATLFLCPITLIMGIGILGTANTFVEYLFGVLASAVSAISLIMVLSYMKKSVDNNKK